MDYKQQDLVENNNDTTNDKNLGLLEECFKKMSIKQQRQPTRTDTTRHERNTHMIQHETKRHETTRHNTFRIRIRCRQS